MCKTYEAYIYSVRTAGTENFETGVEDTGYSYSDIARRVWGSHPGTGGTDVERQLLMNLRGRFRIQH